MPNKSELYMSSDAMKLQEDAIYNSYKAATRKLLIENNAEDLLPMLGLEEETNVSNNNTQGSV
jgi:hypothetical protein